MEEGAAAMGLMTRWTNGERVAPEPLEGPVTGTVVAGTVIWFVLFLAQLPFYDWYADHHHTWFLWTCAAGGGLGFIGLWYVRGREKALRRAAAAEDGPAD
jgi:hypothetical protein